MQSSIHLGRRLLLVTRKRYLSNDYSAFLTMRKTQEFGFMKFFPEIHLSKGLFLLFSQSTEALTIYFILNSFQHARRTTAVANDLSLVQLDGGQHSLFYSAFITSVNSFNPPKSSEVGTSISRLYIERDKAPMA